MNYTPSIFEELSTHQSTNLWERAFPNLSKFEIRGELEGWKKLRNPGEFGQRTFFFSENFLYYKKPNSSKIKAILDLKLCRVNFSEIGQEGSEFDEKKYKELKYALTISKNKKYTEILFKNFEDIQSWKNCLKPYAIFTDFHDSFKPLHLLGEGESAKVRKIF